MVKYLAFSWISRYLDIQNIIQNQWWNILLSAGAASPGNETQTFRIRLGGEQWFFKIQYEFLYLESDLAVSNYFSYSTDVCARAGYCKGRNVVLWSLSHCLCFSCSVSLSCNKPLYYNKLTFTFSWTRTS